MNKTFTFEGFSDNFTSEDEFSDWPEMSVEMFYTLHPAEPDVGIFGSQLEITEIRYYLDDDEFDHLDLFVIAVYAAIADDIGEDEEEVGAIIRDQLNSWQASLGDD